MSYTIALNFEDGVTRFISCNEDETVLDAAYRAHIRLPMDCSDGVCGTCKGACSQGQFDLGDEYIDDALSDDEVALGKVLTCQMVPSSDCVVEIPVASGMCKAAPSCFETHIEEVNLVSPTSIELKLKADTGIDFLSGQYVNIQVPGTDQVRAYSFSSKPNSENLSFLIRNVSGGLMSTHLTGKAKTGDALTLTGPMGSFYLRSVERPVLMLAGGTGLAPFLSMLAYLKEVGFDQPVHLIYGVTNEDDLVGLAQLEAMADAFDLFTFTSVVANPDSGHPRTGFVTHHMETLDVEGADVYLCGPPPMVDAVLTYFSDQQITPNAFHYEKFSPGAAQPEEKVA